MDGTWLYCSGTLISPTVFLTAAHCGTDGEQVVVTFDGDYEDGDKVYYGTFRADPLYPCNQSDSHDIAVVVFDKAVKGITPAQLPEAGSLSDLSGPPLHFCGVRRLRGDQRAWRPSLLLRRPPDGGHRRTERDQKTWLRISMNASTGNGGTCYGDSGGRSNFLGTTAIIAGITITGDAVCRSTNVDYRLDTESARAFLGQFVLLP